MRTRRSLLKRLTAFALGLAAAAGCHRDRPPLDEAGLWVVVWFGDLEHWYSDRETPQAFGVLRRLAVRSGAAEPWGKAEVEELFRSRRELRSLLEKRGLVEVVAYRASHDSRWQFERMNLPSGEDSLSSPSTPRAEPIPLGGSNEGFGGRAVLRATPALPDGRRFVVVCRQRLGMSAPMTWPMDTWTSVLLVPSASLQEALAAKGSGSVVEAIVVDHSGWRHASDEECRECGIFVDR